LRCTGRASDVAGALCGGISSTFENRRTRRGSRGDWFTGGLGLGASLAAAGVRGMGGVVVVPPNRSNTSVAVMVGWRLAMLAALSG
jgi:hypothetical protein